VREVVPPGPKKAVKKDKATNRGKRNDKGN
jgi:hypothetical protein